MATFVVNRYLGDCTSGISIMRPGPWGNPFIIGKDGNRTQVMDKYRKWLHDDKQKSLRGAMQALLKDQTLICCCKPLPCHGDIIKEFLDG